MQVEALRTVQMILEHGSFAAAAQAVGCTPSAVSLQVKQMESWFGRPLFDRSARAARPTPLAREVGAIAREMTARLDGLRARPPRGVSGRVRLGAIATVQADALPGALRLLRDRHPALEVAVSLNDSDILLSDLKAGRLDAAVLVRPASGGSSRLAWDDLARQPFVMLAPADAPGAGPREVVQALGWIRYDPTLTGGRMAARYVRQAHPSARCVMELRSIDAIVAMVAAGLGFGVVPRPRQPVLDAYAVREIRLGRGAPHRQIALVRRVADVDSRNLEAVRDALVAAYAAEHA